MDTLRRKISPRINRNRALMRQTWVARLYVGCLLSTLRMIESFWIGLDLPICRVESLGPWAHSAPGWFVCCFPRNEGFVRRSLSKWCSIWPVEIRQSGAQGAHLTRWKIVFAPVVWVSDRIVLSYRVGRLIWMLFRPRIDFIEWPYRLRTFEVSVWLVWTFR